MRGCRAACVALTGAILFTSAKRVPIEFFSRKHISAMSAMSAMSTKKKKLGSASCDLFQLLHIFTHPKLGPLTCIAGRITGPGEVGLIPAGLQETATDLGHREASCHRYHWILYDTIATGIRCILLLPFRYGLLKTSIVG